MGIVVQKAPEAEFQVAKFSNIVKASGKGKLSVASDGLAARLVTKHLRSQRTSNKEQMVDVLGTDGVVLGRLQLLNQCYCIQQHLFVQDVGIGGDFEETLNRFRPRVQRHKWTLFQVRRFVRVEHRRGQRNRNGVVEIQVGEVRWLVGTIHRFKQDFFNSSQGSRCGRRR